MQSEIGVEAGCHFAGVNSYLMIRYLRETGGAESVAQLLRTAGETRSADDLYDLGTWSSYDQFRRLLEVMAETSGDEALKLAAGGGLADPSMPELTNMLQSLGSPEALLTMIAESGGASLAPVIGLHGHAVGPTEWVVHEHFVDGFPHPAALRHARRGRAPRVRMRGRACLRIPHPLVPR
jgi:hypothetical protein